MTTTHQDLAAQDAAIIEHINGWASATYGWTGGEAERLKAKADHDAECVRRIRAALETASQPPGAVGREGWQDDLAWRIVRAACETEPADEEDPECIRILRLDLKSAVLAALLNDDFAPPLPSPAQAPVVQGEAPKPLTCTDAIAGWHACTDAHERVTAFEWFSAGILFAERAHGIGVKGADQ